MIYILWGADVFSIEETLQKIKDNCGESSLLSSNTNLFEGQKVTVNELKSVGEAMPFLSPKRLIIIRGLLARFEPRDKANRSKKTNGPGNHQEESKVFADCILGLPESTMLVIIDSFNEIKNPLKNNSLFNAISEKAEVKSFPIMNSSKLSQWIQSRIAQYSGSISNQATNLLAEFVGGDLYTMTNEINKLVAFTGGRLIEEKDVRAVVSASREADIFSLIDAIMDRKAGQAEQILQKLLQTGTVPGQILVLLARQIQLLIQLKDLKSQKRPLAEIQAKLGIFSSFVWRKMTTRAEKYTMERLKQIYLNLLEADLAIKTGRFEGDLALNVLVAGLCES